MVHCVILDYRLLMAKPQVYCECVASIVCWSVLQVVADQMGRWGRNETSVQKGCSVKLGRLYLIFPVQMGLSR